ncbi:MAG: UDP-2,3-diacylglucosamine diphosphatase [Bacteroidales bacterium]|nr:UDP-2,3-diacylglucosamine diphosphatase [Bacteroidales bacterium]MBD5376622.1 UDP-2,3-diacylglucosamine diphosphatase [Bacteroides sp.]
MNRPPKAYFVADLHLGAAYIADPREHELRVVRWLEEEVRPNATQLFLLGDVLDFWWEYRTVVPRGFTRFLGTLARLADSGVEITWLKGNHDIWLFDYLRSEIGMRVIDGALEQTILGSRFFMEHGDGVGRLPRSFRMLRALFRWRPAQRLFAAVHPRWTLGLAHAWSARSRRRGGYLGDARQDDTAVLAPLESFARSFEAENPHRVDYFVFGHVHRTASLTLPGGARMIVLGDWIERFTYATFEGTEMRLHTFQG